MFMLLLSIKGGHFVVRKRGILNRHYTIGQLIKYLFRSKRCGPNPTHWSKYLLLPITPTIKGQFECQRENNNILIFIHQSVKVMMKKVSKLHSSTLIWD